MTRRNGPADVSVLLNAVRFVFVEDKEQAEEQLQLALARNPSDRRIGANLGFLYAMEILGIDTMAGEVLAPLPATERAGRVERATGRLEGSSDPAVLAGAATALPNLSVRASRGQQVNPEVFQLSSKLMARARAMEPTDEEFRGPMPMIRHFEEATRSATEAPSPIGRAGVAIGGIMVVAPQPPQPVLAANPPSRIRVGGNVQKANLIQRIPPKYPELARREGITGEVQLEAVIDRDGKVSSLQASSGHPLLIPAALEATRQWVYRPTLLNGVPVEVVTTIVVSFPPE